MTRSTREEEVRSESDGFLRESGFVWNDSMFLLTETQQQVITKVPCALSHSSCDRGIFSSVAFCLRQPEPTQNGYRFSSDGQISTVFSNREAAMGWLCSCFVLTFPTSAARSSKDSLVDSRFLRHPGRTNIDLPSGLRIHNS